MGMGEKQDLIKTDTTDMASTSVSVLLYGQVSTTRWKPFFEILIGMS